MAKNGRGIIHGWLTDKVDKGWTQEEYFARIEGARQATKEHYEFSQRPIIRTNHPEYVPFILSPLGPVCLAPVAVSPHVRFVGVGSRDCVLGWLFGFGWSFSKDRMGY
jgi:hypothetical protein